MNCLWMSLRSSFSKAVNALRRKSSLSFLTFVRQSFSPFERFPEVSSGLFCLSSSSLHSFTPRQPCCNSAVIRTIDTDDWCRNDIFVLWYFVPCQVVYSQAAVLLFQGSGCSSTSVQTVDNCCSILCNVS